MRPQLKRCIEQLGGRVMDDGRVLGERMWIHVFLPAAFPGDVAMVEAFDVNDPSDMEEWEWWRKTYDVATYKKRANQPCQKRQSKEGLA